MAQGLSTPDPFLSPFHKERSRNNYTRHSLMVSRNTTLVRSLWLRIGQAYEVGLSTGMRRERVPPQRRKGKAIVQCLAGVRILCWYGQGCCGMWIGYRTQAFEWYQWPWVTSNPDFKVTPLFDASTTVTSFIFPPLLSLFFYEFCAVT